MFMEGLMDMYRRGYQRDSNELLASEKQLTRMYASWHRMHGSSGSKGISFQLCVFQAVSSSSSSVGVMRVEDT